MPKRIDIQSITNLSSPLGGEQSRPRAEHKGRDVGGKLTTLARQMRKEPTDAERKLWYRLSRKQLGYNFRRQHPMGKQYIADFICLEKKLIIELDGSQHIERKNYDAQRDGFLAQEGYHVLRFWNNEVMQHIDAVLLAILYALEHTPHASDFVNSSSAAPPKGGAKGSAMPKRTDIQSILIIGAGPIVIGQTCEFDSKNNATSQLGMEF